MFLRLNQGLPLFDPALFNERYLKVRNNDLDEETSVNDLEADDNDNVLKEANNNDVSVESFDDDFDKGDLKAMTRQQKYRMVSPVLERLTEALVRCGTERAIAYKKELEIVLKRVESGEYIFPETNDIGKGSNPEVETSNNDEVKSDKGNAIKADNKDGPSIENDDNKFDLNFHGKFRLIAKTKGKSSTVRFSKKGNGKASDSEPHQEEIQLNDD